LTREGYETQNFETLCIKLNVTDDDLCYVEIT